MKIWPGLALEDIPQLWEADASALRKLDILSVRDLQRAVRDDGIHKLSESSGVPAAALRAYGSVADALLARQKTLRWASAVSALAVSIVLVVSGVMVVVQAELPFKPAERDYADLYRQHANAATDAQVLLPVVLDKISQHEGEPAKTLVNLHLLSSALQDGIALETLQSAAEDPTSSAFSARYADYEDGFRGAREALAPIDPNDSRMAFARVNTARAWMNRATVLERIYGQLSAADATRARQDIREAEEQARLHALLARIAPGAQTVGLLQPSADLALVAGDTLSLPESNVATAAEESELAAVTELLASREATLVAAVDTAHEETRQLIRELAEVLNVRLATLQSGRAGSLAESDDADVELLGELIINAASAPLTADCGFVNLERATQSLRRQCTSGGLAERVSFVVTVTSTADEPVQVDVDGPTDHSLTCDVAEVLEDLPYEVGTHDCRLTFAPSD